MSLRRLAAFIAVVFLTLGFLASEAFAKKVDIVISKVSQKMTVRVDGDIEYVWPVSTGAAKYETPTGTFKPFRMEAEHFSKEWDDAPMPHSIFFTGEGHAIHGSFHVKSLGRKASHGCVRLSPENAAILFTLVQTAGMSNTRITLKGGLFDFGGNRSFAEVGNDMSNILDRKPGNGFFFHFGKPKDKVAATPAKKASVKVKKPVAAKPVVLPAKADAKTKKVAEECTAKGAKTPCVKAPAAKAAKAG